MKKKYLYVWAIYIWLALILIVAGCVGTPDIEEELGEAEPTAFVPFVHGESTAMLMLDPEKVSISVFPTVVQIGGIGTEYDLDSRDLLTEFFRDIGIGTIEVIDEPIDLSITREVPQFQHFRDSLQLTSRYLAHNPVSTSFVTFVECIMHHSQEENIQGVWAIQAYFLDSIGLNVNSFLLNSHWPLFEEAELFVEDTSDDSRYDLIQRSVETVVQALQPAKTFLENLDGTSYTERLNWQTKQLDGGSDANNAVTMPSPQVWYEGFFGNRGDQRWYKLSVSRGLLYRIYIDDETGSGEYTAEPIVYLYEKPPLNLDDYQDMHRRRDFFISPIEYSADSDIDLYIRIDSENDDHTTFAIGFAN